MKRCLYIEIFTKKNAFYTMCLCLSFLFLNSCEHQKGPDVSAITVNTKILRFDSTMSRLNSQSISKMAPSIRTQYGAFYDDYISGMLQAGHTLDTNYYKNLRAIITNPDYVSLQKDVMEKFKDMHPYEESLNDAFKHVKYYFPEQPIPQFIAFFSGFAVQVPVGDNYIGIGLDMFLGANSTYYPALRQSIPQYISRRFTPENIVPRVTETYVREDLYPEPEQVHSLLDRMIYNGKVMYVLSSFLPEQPDSLLMGYTKPQQEWVEKYESGIWGYFLQENLLYETDYMKVQKYLTEAPFTPGLGEHNESAPKLAVYLGWKIVQKYMEEHPQTALKELLMKKDAQAILNESHYRPK